MWLVEDYYDVNCIVYWVEINVELMGDMEIIELCKKCVVLKDEIYWMLVN